MIMSKQQQVFEQHHHQTEEQTLPACDPNQTNDKPASQSLGLLLRTSAAATSTENSAPFLGLEEAAGSQAAAGARPTTGSRNHRPEAKLNVVISEAQKSLLTPTIVTTADGAPVNGVGNGNGLAAAATPIRLFSSLVYDAGLFTGLPGCTPGSGEPLAAGQPSSINPFFYGVSGFNGQTNGQLQPDELKEAPAQEPPPLVKQPEPATEHNGQAQEVGLEGQQQARHQLNKLSLDQIHAANVLMLSPLLLPLSPEHEAWLRQFSLNGHQTPSASAQQEAYNQSMNQAMAYQQHEQHVQQQIAAARAVHDLTNQVPAHQQQQQQQQQQGSCTANTFMNGNTNSIACPAIQQQVHQQEQSFYTPRAAQGQQLSPLSLQNSSLNGQSRVFFPNGTLYPASSGHHDNKQHHVISDSPYANHLAYTQHPQAPAQPSPLRHHQQAGQLLHYRQTDPNNNQQQSAQQLQPQLAQGKLPPLAHNQTSVIQQHCEQAYQPPGPPQRPPNEPPQVYSNSNSNSSSVVISPPRRSSSTALDHSVSSVTLTSSPRSSTSRDTINLDYSARPAPSLDNYQAATISTGSKSAPQTTKEGNKLAELHQKVQARNKSAALENNNQNGAPLEGVKKKSKGGRKKKLITAEEMVARKNKSKERNRVAAKRCRQKRKQFLDELRDRIENLNDLNRKLQKENTTLKSELESLKQRHKSCRI